MSRPAVLCGLLVGALALAGAGGRSAESDHAKLKVGVVLGPATNTPYDRLTLAGLRKAMRQLGVEAKVLAPGQKEGYLPTFLYLARRGYDLVIGGSALQDKAVDRAAVAFPKIRFAILDVPQEALPHRPKNAVGVTFAAEEASYLAGYFAGRMEKRRPGKDVVSSVGGIKAPPVDAYVAGYQAGARRAARGITTLNAYTLDFLDQADCKRAALAQIAKGSGVVFPVAGVCGFGALQAAKEKGAWGIGVDSDQSSLGPHILTSAVKNVDVAVYDVIRRAQQGRLEGGRTIVFGLRAGGVGLGKISPKVPRALVARVEQIRRLIAAGKIQVPTTLK